MKVSSPVTTATGMQTGGQAAPPRVGGQPDPMVVLLFGKQLPRRIDARRRPQLRRGKRKLEAVKDQIAEALGQLAGDFSISLCDGNNACITRDGEIRFGAELLEQHQHDDDLLVGILGHELGHQPWSWPPELPPWPKKKLDQLYRDEEAKADYVAGWVLAALEASPDSLCQFLVRAEQFEARRSSQYYPAEVRAQIIRKGYRAYLARQKRRRVRLGGGKEAGRALR